LNAPETGRIVVWFRIRRGKQKLRDETRKLLLTSRPDST